MSKDEEAYSTPPEEAAAAKERTKLDLQRAEIRFEAMRARFMSVLNSLHEGFHVPEELITPLRGIPDRFLEEATVVDEVRSELQQGRIVMQLELCMLEAFYRNLRAKGAGEGYLEGLVAQIEQRRDALARAEEIKEIWEMRTRITALRVAATRLSQLSNAAAYEQGMVFDVIRQELGEQIRPEDIEILEVVRLDALSYMKDDGTSH